VGDDTQLRLADFGVEDSTRNVIIAARDFLRAEIPTLYLWGGPGSGKTLLLKALVNEFNIQGQVAVYAKFSRLLWWMRNVFGENGNREGYLDRYERLKRTSVLAIDEVDKANMTSFAMEFQFDFFDDRYEAGLRGESLTIFASNSPPDDLPPYLLSRLQDGRCRIVENMGPDLRPHLGGNNV